MRGCTIVRNLIGDHLGLRAEAYNVGLATALFRGQNLKNRVPCLTYWHITARLEVLANDLEDSLVAIFFLVVKTRRRPFFGAERREVGESALDSAIDCHYAIMKADMQGD